jgi:hypothetical protein
VNFLYRTSTQFGLSLLLVGIAACGGGDAPPAEGAGEEGSMSGMEGMSGPTAAGGGISVLFAEVDGSAAGGNVNLTRSGEEYTAAVTIETHRGPGDYPIRIHSGTCATDGAVVLELNSVEGQEGGEGSSRTSFPVTQLPMGDHAVRIYDAQAGNVLACADLHVM